MVKQSDYGLTGEKIVFDYLKKTKKYVYLHHTKGYHKKFGDIQVGKNEDTCKIIEVKGEGEDHNTKTKWDIPRHHIQISKTEFGFLKKHPDRFAVYVVYRLKYNKNPKLNKPKIAICEGKDLLKCESEVRQVFLKTPNKFWQNTKQIHP